MELDQEIGRMWLEGTRAERSERSEHKVLYLVIKYYCFYYFLEVKHLRKSTLLLTSLFLCSSIFRESLVLGFWHAPKHLILFMAGGEGGNGRQNGWMAFTDSRDMCLSKLQKMVKDREAWHGAVYGVAESRLSNWITTKPNLEKYCLGTNKHTDS